MSQSDPLEITADYRESAPPARTSAHRPKVLLMPGASSGDSELQTLLRQRLRLIATICSIASALAVVQKLLSFDPNGGITFWRLVWTWPDLAMGLLNAVLFAALAAILWRKALPSLRRLRAYELLIFGEGLLTFGINNWYVLNNYGWLAQFIRLQHLNILASALTNSWLIAIVGYGTLIPNTGRRCAMVVSVFALTGLAMTAISLVRNSVSGIDAARFLLQMGIFVMLAVAVAIVGSHRLEILRREASVARRLGQYQLKQRLGAGGMGEVYLPEHLLLRRPCAVKLIRPERTGDPQDLRRFEREVQTTATLSHPNTIQIYDYGHAADGTFYYAMEYLPGLTLDQLVERHGPLTPARAVHFLRQLCGSLREAHGAGLVHRDIKPGNVMICERGGVKDVAKLLDFGLVRSTRAAEGGEKLTQDGALAGTPAYMSPEQAAGKELDARSDIYSVGALAYFLLIGKPPFSGRSPVMMLAAHLYEHPAPLGNIRPDVPPELDVMIQRCLSKNPAERFANAELLDAALSACAATGAWTEKDACAWWRSKS